MSEPPEIVIYDESGAPEPSRRTRPPSEPNPAARRGTILAIAALLIFAVGFGVGRGTANDGPNAAAENSTAANETPSGAGDLDANSSPGALATTSAGPGSESAEHGGSTITMSPGTGSGGLGAGEPVGRTTCGGVVPLATVDATEKLPADAQRVRLVVGTQAWLVDSARPSNRGPLLPSGGSSAAIGGVAGGEPSVVSSAGPSTSSDPGPGSDVPFVVDLKQVGDHLLVVSSACQPGPVSLSTITAVGDGFAIVGLPVTLPGPGIVGAVGGIGGQGYVAVFSDKRADNGMPGIRLVPAGGTSAAIEVPEGFVPIATVGALVVGSLHGLTAAPQPAPTGFTLQVLDPRSDAVVSQLGTLMENMIVSGDSVTWQPLCTDACTLRRYNVVTGADRLLGPAPTVGIIGGGSTAVDGSPTDNGSAAGDAARANWVAISPDGGKLAMVVPADPDAPADAVTHGHVVGETSYSLLVVDTASGAAVTAPQLSLPWQVAAAVFSPDSRWLYVAVPTVGGAQVIAYDVRGLTGSGTGAAGTDAGATAAGSAGAGDSPPPTSLGNPQRIAAIVGPYRVTTVPDPGNVQIPLAILPGN